MAAYSNILVGVGGRKADEEGSLLQDMFYADCLHCLHTAVWLSDTAVYAVVGSPVLIAPTVLGHDAYIYDTMYIICVTMSYQYFGRSYICTVAHRCDMPSVCFCCRWVSDLPLHPAQPDVVDVARKREVPGSDYEA